MIHQCRHTDKERHVQCILLNNVIMRLCMCVWLFLGFLKCSDYPCGKGSTCTENDDGVVTCQCAATFEGYLCRRKSSVIYLHLYNPSTGACHCTPRLREDTAIRASADNAAAVQRVQNCAARLVSRTRKYATTSRQCCNICTGYRFVCARHTKCFCLCIRLCMNKHRVNSLNYYHVVNPIAD